MECSDCQKKVVLFKCKDGELRCIKCMKINGEAKIIESEHEGEYIIRWRLRDTNNDAWIEEMEHMTLADFEVVYGNNIHEILWLTMRQKNVALI